MDNYIIDIAVIVVPLFFLIGGLSTDDGVYAIYAFILIPFSIVYIADSYSFNETLTVLLEDVHMGDDETSTSVGVNLKGNVGVTHDVKSRSSVLKPYQVAVIPESSGEMVTFTNKDDLFRWKFDSQAIQTHFITAIQKKNEEGKETDKRFQLTVYGFLGYQNILSAKAVEEAPQQK